MENDKQFPVKVPAPDNQWPSPPYYYEKEGQLHHLMDYWHILLKRKWWVLGFFVSCVLIVALVSFLMTPIYRSSIILQITQDKASALLGMNEGLAMLSPEFDSQNRFIETQSMILSSRPLMYRIMDSLNLREHPEFKTFKKRHHDWSPQEVDAAFADELLKKLEVTPLKRSYLMEVSFQSEDRKLAQQVPNTIYKEFLKFSMQTRQQSYKLIKEWLEGELVQLANKVESSEKKLYEHGQVKDFLSLEGKENVIVKKFVELNSLLTKAQADRVSKEALYKQVRSKGANSSPMTNNLLIQKLRQEVITQEAKVSGINKIYDENYPQLQAEQAKLNDLRERLNNEVQRLQKSIETDYEAALSTEKLLREAIANQKGQVTNLQDNLVQHHILKRDVQTNEQLYQGLLARMKEANVASTMISSNVAVIAPAEFPYRPYRPRKKVNVLVAALVGLVGGVGLAFLVERLDSSIKNVEEMEQVFSKPNLGLVPLLSRDNGAEPPTELFLASHSHPRSLISESIRQVRTAIMLSSAAGPPGTLMITSANPNEGKTTLALNLAISLTLNARKVAVIDCDLRKPSIHALFQEPAAPGLSDFLTGNARFSDISKLTKVPGMVIIPAGTIPPSPPDLFASEAFKDFVKRLRQYFQLLIFDTPPVTMFADAQVLSPLMDGILVVCKHHSTTREAALHTKRLLLQVNGRVLGTILNMAAIDKMGYGYGYPGSKHYLEYYAENTQSRPS